MFKNLSSKNFGKIENSPSLTNIIINVNQKRKSFSTGHYSNKNNKTINFNNYYRKKSLYNNNLKFTSQRFNNNLLKNNVLLNKIINMKKKIIKDKKYSSVDSINKNKKLNIEFNNNNKYLKLYKEKGMGQYNFKIRLNLKKAINRIESDLFYRKMKV